MIRLKTLYIDVYFLINFTVDILSAFVSLKLTHTTTTVKRLILLGALGGIFAIADVFAGNNKGLNLIIWLMFSLMLIFLVCKRAAFVRRVKFTVFFYIASFAISGLVNYVYTIFDKYFSEALSAIDGGGENRHLLIFSVIILLAIGVFRILIMLFSSSMGEKSVRLQINIEENSINVEALIDSGNLVKDPMNMNPVVFIKKETAEKIFPCSVIELSNIDSMESSYKKRIRLIPVSKNGATHVMTGVRVDDVYIIGADDSKERIEATVVIDKEEGTFGGYYALAPYAAVKDAL